VIDKRVKTTARCRGRGFATDRRYWWPDLAAVGVAADNLLDALHEQGAKGADRRRPTTPAMANYGPGAADQLGPRAAKGDLLLFPRSGDYSAFPQGVPGQEALSWNWSRKAPSANAWRLPCCGPWRIFLAGLSRDKSWLEGKENPRKSTAGCMCSKKTPERRWFALIKGRQGPTAGATSLT